MEARNSEMSYGPTQAPSNLWLDALRHLLEKRSAVIGLIMLGALTLIALLAPVLAPNNPTQILKRCKAQYPSLYPSSRLP